MNHSRRQFLKFGAGLVSAATSSQAFSASISAPLIGGLESEQPQRTLQLRNLHTDEVVKATYWEKGQYQLDSLDDINRVLRDHRANEVTLIDPMLLDQLHSLQNSLSHRGELHIISAYRSPETNAKLLQQGHKVAKRSFHMQGRAIDIRVPGVHLRTTQKAALAMQAGGVGYYPRSGFIHLDTGRVRRWG